MTNVEVGQWRWAPLLVKHNNVPAGFPVEVTMAAKGYIESEKDPKPGRYTQHCRVRTVSGRTIRLTNRVLGKNAPASAVKEARRERMRRTLKVVHRIIRDAVELDGSVFDDDELAVMVNTLHVTVQGAL